MIRDSLAIHHQETGSEQPDDSKGIVAAAARDHTESNLRSPGEAGIRGKAYLRRPSSEGTRVPIAQPFPGGRFPDLPFLAKLMLLGSPQRVVVGFAASGGGRRAGMGRLGDPRTAQAKTPYNALQTKGRWVAHRREER
jgi:hypothetical protein